ncbi:MAG: phosphate acyltransferase PlsX [Firmicutes bacterium]|nr:phosphate acyltransferase PlsX [Bacillota bacterium]
MNKIVIDILGGDNAPNAQLEGAILAAARNTDLHFILIGDESIIKPRVEEAGIIRRCEIIHTTENISCDEAPTVVRTKTNSSIALGMEALRKRDDAAAFVSSGSTGAVLAGAVMRVGRIPGVSRPALCPLLPTKKPGVKTMVVDVGANVDCRPEHLLHFAIMGSEFMRARGVENPRVALVNVGVEDKKGNELTAATFELLKQTDLNFVGNMECKDAFSGDYDVLICDGFVGNVLLKTAEGSMKMLMTMMREKMTSNFITKMGALLVKKKLKELKAELSDEEVGGSVFIGAKKPIVKAHGSSNAIAFSNAILVAARAVELDINTRIEAAIARNSLGNTGE